MRWHPRSPLLFVLGALGCQQIIGADFDDAHLAEEFTAGTSAGGNSGMSGRSGSGGSDAGGSAGVAGTSGGGSAGENAGGSAGSAGGGEAGIGGTSGSGGAGGSGGSSGSAGMGGSAGTGGGAPFTVVVNEIRSNSPDYVELYNGGTAEFNLSGYRLADDNGGTPKLSEALRFPDGAVIPAGGRVVVYTGSDVTTANCTGVTVPCYVATFGISNSSGDRIYILHPTENTPVLTQSDILPNVDTYCRFPDGAATWAVCAATPGGQNSLL